MERFLEYWRAAVYQQQLHALVPTDVQHILQKVSRVECSQGKLMASDLGCETIVVIPFYAQRADQYFFPCMLVVTVNAQGDLVAQKHFSLPIIPRYILEPAPLSPISLGLVENFDNYMAINPPQWLEDTQELTWGAQLAYVTAMLKELAPNWRKDLVELGYSVSDDALLFNLTNLPARHQEVLQDLNFELLEHPNKITLIDADRNFDSGKYAQKLIVNAWIQAALKQIDPPLYVSIEPHKKVGYANIFACMEANTMVHTTEDVHPRLLAEHESYLQGQQSIRNWQEFTKRIHEKYIDKGGVQARLHHLQNCAKEAKALSRHLQVLNSIWIRQKELLVEWSKFFDFIPTLQTQRLQRLHRFFKQNFPNESVTGFTQIQFDDLINEKMRRAENNERMIGDALHQVENDLYQETLVRGKCLQWCSDKNFQSQDLVAIKEYLEGTVWQELARTALLYWQQDFSAKQGYANFLNVEPIKIDLLIAEHAEYISPLDAIVWLAKSKKAIVMGNYNPICSPRFCVQIDYELTKHFGLAENDADFEDLQFDGVLASLGNMWNMVAKEREADHIFSDKEKPQLNFRFIDISSVSESYAGSTINKGVIDRLLQDLNEYADQKSDITIYTCFAGQVQLLQQALSTTSFTQIPIRLMQEPNFIKSNISIFMPVYCADDFGPYIFDRGTEMLDQLLANTKQNLIIIGDMRIFKPELHSATGKFAKLIFKQEKIENINSNENTIIITEEEAQLV